MSPLPALILALAVATRRDDTGYEQAGVYVPDPYLWLEDGDSPEVRAWTAAQDRETRAALAAIPERPALAARFAALLQVSSVGPPVSRGGRLFYERVSAGPGDDTASRRVLVWREGDQEHVLLDPNTWADPTLTLGAWTPSPDGRHVAWLAHPHGADEAELHVVDVSDRPALRPRDLLLGATWASPDWSADSRGFYYEWAPTDPAVPAVDRPGLLELRYHPLGADPRLDPTFFPPTHDPRALLQGQLAADGRHLFAYVEHGWSAVDVYVRDLVADGGRPDTPWQPFFVGRPSVTFLDAWGGAIYAYTNDGAPNYRIFRVDPAHPAPPDWRLVVPERPDALLDDWSLVGGRLALAYQRVGVTELALANVDGTDVRALPLPGEGVATVPRGRPDSADAWSVYSSLPQPLTLLHLALGPDSGARLDVAATSPVPFDPADVTVDRVDVPSTGGASVPTWRVHRRGLVADGRNPTVLSAYGGFSVATTPAFRASIWPWLEGGGTYVLVGARGGSERGEAWHQDGSGVAKQHTFDDVIAVGEALIHEGWTSPAHLGVMGASNGGLTVGAVVTQRPDLWGAAVAQVPLLDLVRFPRFGVGASWIGEYGDPADPVDLARLLGLSPYHRIREGTRYPAVLVETADHDDRVDPMHARTFVAALQHATVGGAPVYLRVEQDAGHVDALRTSVDLQADTWAFFTDRLRR